MNWRLHRKVYTVEIALADLEDKILRMAKKGGQVDRWDKDAAAKAALARQFPLRPAVPMRRVLSDDPMP